MERSHGHARCKHAVVRVVGCEISAAARERQRQKRGQKEDHDGRGVQLRIFSILEAERRYLPEKEGDV